MNAENPIRTKKVDIVIAGNTYSINCPENEEDSLQKAASFIHNQIRDIRQEAPNLTHENLLVLCCLNLYEKIHQQEVIDNAQRLENERVQTLIDKISADAKSILIG